MLNDREMDALRAIQSTKGARDIAPDAVQSVFEEACARNRNLRDAQQWTRKKLHQMSGMFMTRAQLANARDCLAQYISGDMTALDRALACHASTRERTHAQELYARVFTRIGTPRAVNDFACGLNPLVLGAMGVPVRGWDMHAGAVTLVNDWAQACSWDVCAAPADVCHDRAYPACDLALMMKLLPVLEQRSRGFARTLFEHANARHVLVTFPTRTMGGRNVGMESHYDVWLAGQLPAGFVLLDRWTQDAESIYLYATEDT